MVSVGQKDLCVYVYFGVLFNFMRIQGDSQYLGILSGVARFAVSWAYGHGAPCPYEYDAPVGACGLCGRAVEGVEGRGGLEEDIVG